MAVSVELLNTTLADLKGPLVSAFLQNVPTFRALEKKGRITADGGTYIERPIMSGSPARGTGIFNGDETLDMTRYKRSKKYQVEFHRVVVPINIPKKELLQNKGKLGAIKLIENYPKVTMDGLSVDMEKYLLTGSSAGIAIDSPELAGFTTFNGQFAAGVGTGVTNGLLDFLAPGSQTDPVQNVTKSLADFHYNQFNTITAFATDGISKLRKTYRQCAQFAGKPNGGPDIIVMDDDTFGNYQDAKLDLVRLTSLPQGTDKGNLLQDVIGVGGVYASALINLSTDFTAAPAAGVTYMINTDFLELVYIQKMTISDFTDQIAQQDAVTAKVEFHHQMVLTKFPAHGCVAGGAS
jgi:hypothetical protein